MDQMKKMIQRRDFDAEFTFQDDEQPCFEGYFIRYNTPDSYGSTEWREQIAPGSVDLADDVVCLYNHNSDVVLGRVSSGTLQLEDREDGLYGRCLLNMDDTEARNVYSRVKRGDIKGCSFGFFIEDQEVDRDNQLITLTKVRTHEVSITPFPFYTETTMEARNRVIADTDKLEHMKQLKADFIKRRLSKKWH